jgi:hypothetical protein
MIDFTQALTLVNKSHDAAAADRARREKPLPGEEPHRFAQRVAKRKEREAAAHAEYLRNCGAEIARREVEIEDYFELIQRLQDRIALLKKEIAKG